MPTAYEYRHELITAIVALRERCVDLRTDSARLCAYGKKLRDKSDRLMNDDADRSSDAATIAA